MTAPPDGFFFLMTKFAAQVSDLLADGDISPSLQASYASKSTEYFLLVHLH